MAFNFGTAAPAPAAPANPAAPAPAPTTAPAVGGFGFPVAAAPPADATTAAAPAAPSSPAPKAPPAAATVTSKNINSVTRLLQRELTFSSTLEKNLENGILPDSFVGAFKEKIAAPFAPIAELKEAVRAQFSAGTAAAAPAAPAPATANPVSGGSGAGGFGGFGAGSRLGAPGATAGAAPGGATIASASAYLVGLSTPQEQDRSDQLQFCHYTARCQDLLRVLLSCQSGYYNAYVVGSSDGATTYTTNEKEKKRSEGDGKDEEEKRLLACEEVEFVAGLHSVMASIAGPCAKHILLFLKKEVTQAEVDKDGASALLAKSYMTLEEVLEALERSNNFAIQSRPDIVGGSASSAAVLENLQFYSSPLTDSSGSGAADGSASTNNNNPYMLAVQCLYLLTRHFQMEVDFVKEALSFLEHLFDTIKAEAHAGRIELASFSTSAVCFPSNLHGATINNSNPAGGASGSATSGANAAGKNNNFYVNSNKQFFKFVEQPRSAYLASFTWFLSFSAMNAFAVWKKLRRLVNNHSAPLNINRLLQSDALDLLDNFLKGLEKRLAKPATRGAASNNTRAGLFGSGSGLGGRQATLDPEDDLVNENTTSQQQQLRHLHPRQTYLSIEESYYNMFLLVKGCFLRQQNKSEQGYDAVLRALLGDHTDLTRELRGGNTAGNNTNNNNNTTNVFFNRGNAVKRMVQLAPASYTVVIPQNYVFIAPYEILSFLFDNVLIVLQHLGSIELKAFERNVEQLHQLEDLTVRDSSSSANARGNVAANRVYGYDRAAGLGYGNTINNMNNNNNNNNGLFNNGMLPAHYQLFLSEIPHLLEALEVCLQHLQPEVLNPDLNSDCAATYFVFQNCILHLRDVFDTQRQRIFTATASTSRYSRSTAAPLAALPPSAVGGSAAESNIWENYTLKLTSRFLNVLSMISRNSEYVERVAALLKEAQDVCESLSWKNLIHQALECAGLSRVADQATDLREWNRFAAATGTGIGAGNSSGGYGQPQVSSSSTGGASGLPVQRGSGLIAIAEEEREEDPSLPRQFTRAYAQKCRREYIASLFLLLRQMLTHRSIRPTIVEHLSLPLALSFIFAPKQSPPMLGSTLSLIAALISDATEARLVWDFLEENELLQPQQGRASLLYNSNAGAVHDATAVTSSSALPQSGVSLRPGTIMQDVTLSIFGHCQIESTKGRYFITIGMLHLLVALFQHDRPQIQRINAYSSAVHAVAQTIFTGVMKRLFLRESERYTVIALGAAALRQALLVHFTDDGGARRLSFDVIMALDRGSADVLGETLSVIRLAATSIGGLSPFQRSATRQCFWLLRAAILATIEQNLDRYTFTSRTVQSASLVQLLLPFIPANDALLAKAALQTLLVLPRSTMVAAASFWYTHLRMMQPLVHQIGATLRVRADTEWGNGSYIAPPPELTVLDVDYITSSSSLAVEVRSLLLDLLTQHATTPQPSLTSWVCELLGSSQAEQPGRRGIEAQRRSREDDDSTTAPQEERRTLDIIVDGAGSAFLETQYPQLAIKYVKLLYLMRTNPLLATGVRRSTAQGAGQSFFLSLLRFMPAACAHNMPVLSKYGYILKLLALELTDVYLKEGSKMEAGYVGVPCVAVEVIKALVQVQSNTYIHAGRVEEERSPRTQRAGSKGRTSSAVYTAAPASGAKRSRLDFSSGYLMPENGIASFAGGLGNGTGADGELSRLAGPSGQGPSTFLVWLQQVMQLLPTAPSCPLPNRATTFFLQEADDHVVQYNITLLYANLQEQQQQQRLPPLTTAEAQQLLRPYVEANECFLMYAVTATFFDGWSQALRAACTLLYNSASSSACRPGALQEFLPAARLRTAEDEEVSVDALRRLALATLHGLARAAIVTTTSRHSITNSLARALSCVMLRLKLQSGAPRVGLSPSLVMTSSCSGCLTVPAENEAEGDNGNQMLLRPLLRALQDAATAVPLVRLQLYTSLLLLINMNRVEVEDCELCRAKDIVMKIVATDIVRGLPNSTGVKPSPNVNTSLFHNAANGGNRYYTSKENPSGVGPTASSSSSSTVGSANLNMKNNANAVLHHKTTTSAVEMELTAEESNELRLHALQLLIRLIEVSPTMRAAFCESQETVYYNVIPTAAATESSSPSPPSAVTATPVGSGRRRLGALPYQTILSLLDCVDEHVKQYFLQENKDRVDVQGQPFVLRLLEAVFQLLSAISHHSSYAYVILSEPAILEKVINLYCWTYSSEVLAKSCVCGFQYPNSHLSGGVGGNGAPHPYTGGVASGTSGFGMNALPQQQPSQQQPALSTRLGANLYVLVRLLFSSLQWLNVLASRTLLVDPDVAAASPTTPSADMRAYVASIHQYLEGKLQTFARQRRQVIDFVLQLANGQPQSEQPFATSDTFALQLYAEVTQFFELLSDSSYQMAEACRELVLELDLTSLLVAFSRSALQGLALPSPPHQQQQQPGVLPSSSENLMSNKQKDLIALTVKHLSHLLLRAEFGNHSATVPNASANSADNYYYHAQIRCDEQKVGQVVRILENVNDSILQYITAPRNADAGALLDNKNVNETFEYMRDQRQANSNNNNNNNNNATYKASRRSHGRESSQSAGDDKGSPATGHKPSDQRSVVHYDEDNGARHQSTSEEAQPFLPLHPLHFHRTLHYIYAVNALVCLLHTIALPSFTDGTASSGVLTTWSSYEDMARDPQSALARKKVNERYLAYLRRLPLRDFQQVLLKTKKTLYALFEFDNGCALRGMSAARYVETHHLLSAPGAAAWDLREYNRSLVANYGKGSGAGNRSPNGKSLLIGGSSSSAAHRQGELRNSSGDNGDSTPATPPTPYFSGGEHAASVGRGNAYHPNAGRSSVPSTPLFAGDAPSSRRQPLSGNGIPVNNQPTTSGPADGISYGGHEYQDADGNRTIGSYMRQVDAPVVPVPKRAPAELQQWQQTNSSYASSSSSLYHILFREDLNTLDEIVRCAKIETANTLRTVKNLYELIMDN